MRVLYLLTSCYKINLCGNSFLNRYVFKIYRFIDFRLLSSNKKSQRLRACGNLFSYSLSPIPILCDFSNNSELHGTTSWHKVKGWELILSQHNELTSTRALTFMLTPSYKMRKTTQLWLAVTMLQIFIASLHPNAVQLDCYNWVYYIALVFYR